MKKKRVWRYYCDFCKKSGCSRGHIADHEKHCTMNPDRECRICKMVDNDQVPMHDLLNLLPDPKDYAYETLNGFSYNVLVKIVDDVLSELREITGNCPACILAALRQKGIPVYIAQNFNFTKECEKKIWDYINGRTAQENYKDF